MPLPAHLPLLRSELFASGSMLRAVRFVGVLALGLAGSSKAAPPDAQQVIDLRAGWNLISLQVAVPISLSEFQGSLTDPGFLQEVWEYRPGGGVPGTWNFAKVPELPDLMNDLEDDELKPGRGYWVRVSQFTQAALTGPTWDGPLDFSEGWNLAGFQGAVVGDAEEQDLGSVFASHFGKVRQVWTFDAEAQRFVGYDLTAIPALAELTMILRGKAYWVETLEGFSLRPLQPRPLELLSSAPE